MSTATGRKPMKRQMWQCIVTDKDGSSERQIAVGPRADSKDVPASLCEAINKQVALGKEKRWRDARVVSVNDLEVA